MSEDQNNCVFCKVAQGGAITPIRYEDDDIIVVDNLHPDAPIHMVVITKRHIISLAHLEELDRDLAGKILLVCKKVAADMHIAENGYRVVTNIGKWGGQAIPHLHFHVLGGVPLSEKVGLAVAEEEPHIQAKTIEEAV
ncbi:MAG: HIT domain-containing protein [Patescibacteria group bacterium]|jgi:histidine triad (HIT) family protein